MNSEENTEPNVNKDINAGEQSWKDFLALFVETYNSKEGFGQQTKQDWFFRNLINALIEELCLDPDQEEIVDAFVNKAISQRAANLSSLEQLLADAEMITRGGADKLKKSEWSAAVRRNRLRKELGKGALEKDKSIIVQGESLGWKENEIS